MPKAKSKKGTHSKKTRKKTKKTVQKPMISSNIAKCIIQLTQNKKLLFSLMIFAILISLVPIFRFGIRIPPVIADLDTNQEQTIIGTVYGGPIGGVFHTIYNGGDRLTKGVNIYDVENVGRDVQGAAFVYPPLMAVMGSPFSYLNLAVAYFIFLAFLILCIYWFVKMGLVYLKSIKTKLKKDYRVLVWLFVIGTFVSTPLVRQFRWGHYMPIVVVLYMAAYHYHEKNEYISGLTLGVSTSFIFYSVFLYPFLLFKKKFIALTTAITTFALSFTPFLINPESAKGFAQFLGQAQYLAFEIDKGIEFFSVQSLFFDIHPLVQKAYVACALLLFLYIAIILWNNHNVQNQNLYKLYFTFLVMFVLIVDIWLSEHHFPLTLIPLVLLIGEKDFHRWLTAGYLLTCMYMYAFHITLLNFYLYTYFRQLGIFVLIGYILYLLWNRAKELKMTLSPFPKLTIKHITEFLGIKRI